MDRVCVEATGVDHLDLAVALHDRGRAELMVLNPKAAKQNGDAIMNRTKTDGVDAGLLCRFSQGNGLTRRTYRPRLCPTDRHADPHQCPQEKNHLHALEAGAEHPAIHPRGCVRLSVTQLDAQIDALRAKALERIAQQAVMTETLSLLRSVKGIGEASTIQLMGERLVLPEDITAKQWVAMADLDPRHHQSGRSMNKKTRISKAGHRCLRQTLSRPALCAAHHDTPVQGYYQHLIAYRGLKKIQAVCAVMRKLLHSIHAMLRGMTAVQWRVLLHPAGGRLLSN